MMRRMLALLLVLLCALQPVWAEGFRYWTEEERPQIVCKNDNPACQVLQMVMLGSFDFFDPEDSLSIRVLSAALAPLCAVTDADIEHFVESFGVEEAAVRRFTYIAMGNCLWASILSGKEPRSNEEQVLLAFLDPQGQEEALAAIRAQLSDGVIAHLAESMRLPKGFVTYLLYADSWHSPLPDPK